MPLGQDLRRIAATPEDAVGVLVLVAILIVTLLAVFYRYVLNDSLIWSEEIARFGLIAITFIGAGTGFRRDAHIRIDLADQVPGPLPGALRLVATLASLVVVTFLVLQAVRIAPVLANSRSASLEIPMAALYLVVAVGLSGGIVRIVLALSTSLRMRVRA